MKNLIDAKSLLFKLILLVTLFLLGFQTKTIIADDSGVSRIIGLCVVILGVVNLTCGLIPWYGQKYKGLGIEQHIERAAVLTTYLLVINHVLFFLNADFLVWRIFLVILFVTILALNLILIYYHLVDKDKTPPSYFAANLYLKTALFVMLSFPVWACPTPKWLSTNRVQLDNLTLDRPNDRWHLVIDHNDTAFAKLVYTTSGDNPKIRIDVMETDYTFSPKRLKSASWQKKFEKNVLASFRKQGFVFAQGVMTTDVFSATGINRQNQNIIVSAKTDADGKSAVLASVVLQGEQSNANDQIKKDFDVVAKNLKLE